MNCAAVLAIYLSAGLASPAVAGSPQPQKQHSEPAAASGFDLKTGFSNWPADRSPEDVGRNLANHYADFPYQGRTIIYPEVCAWYGALIFADAIHDAGLRDRLIGRFAPLLPAGADAATRTPKRHHVDDEIFGVIPLEIAIETRGQPGYNPVYLKLGLSFADRQWEPPQPGVEYPGAAIRAADLHGLSPETRFWIDDMYMLTLLQLEAYRATGDRKYLDRDAQEMTAYLDKLQQPNGLFFHAPDVPYFWGRGDGWAAAGMAEMLRSLPPDHPQRPRIFAAYREMMAALLKYQGPDGTWRQLIDHPEAWPETSASAMFSFAMITGVKHGWLDANTYGPAARRAWIALSGYIDQDNDVTEVCEGTNKYDSLEYYLLRKRRTGDLHGQASMLWAAAALVRDEH
jgi:unsaturated rhamnogalacturonyl hydrolase